MFWILTLPELSDIDTEIAVNSQFVVEFDQKNCKITKAKSEMAIHVY